MGEKRKPKYTIMLRKQSTGINNKIEMFPASLWTSYFVDNDNLGRDHFRVRLNGQWWPKGKVEYFTKTYIKELIFKNLES